MFNLEEKGWNLTCKGTSSEQQYCAGEEWGRKDQEKWVLDSSQIELFPHNVRLTFYLIMFLNHKVLVSNQEG